MDDGKEDGCVRIILPDSRHVSVEQHSGQIWLTSYNRCGVVNSLTRQQAIQLRAMLLGAIVDMEKAG
jgi:hypothetical protein